MTETLTGRDKGFLEQVALLDCLNQQSLCLSEIMPQYIVWRVFEEDTWHQTLAVTCTHIYEYHIHIYIYDYHTLIHMQKSLCISVIECLLGKWKTLGCIPSIEKRVGVESNTLNASIGIIIHFENVLIWLLPLVGLCVCVCVLCVCVCMLMFLFPQVEACCLQVTLHLISWESLSLNLELASLFRPAG